MYAQCERDDNRGDGRIIESSIPFRHTHTHTHTHTGTHTLDDPGAKPQTLVRNDIVWIWECGVLIVDLAHPWGVFMG